MIVTEHPLKDDAKPTRRSRSERRRYLARRLNEIDQLKQSRDIAGLISKLSDKAETGAICLRAEAARALGKLNNADAIPSLALLLRDENAVVRASAARALAEIDHPRAVPALVRALDHPQPAVQRWATVGLRRLRDPSALPALVKLLFSEEWLTRRRAAEAVAEIGEPAGLEPLRQAVAREPLRHRLGMVRALWSLKRKAKRRR